MRAFLIFLIFGFSFYPHKDVLAFPVGGVFKICSMPADGCLAPGGGI